MNRQRETQNFCSCYKPLLMVALLALGAGAFAADEDQGHDQHAGHDMSAHSTERDDKGRRLHGMKHEVSPEVLAELQQKIRGWENISADEVALRMVRMGPNYQWYISKAGVSGKTGAVVLLHGFRDRGDAVFRDRLQPYANVFPISLALGMSMMMSQHIQLAIDDLVAMGAENIVVVPVVATEHNTMIRQWQYIFGLRDEPGYATVPRIESKARLVFAKPPGDDPFVAEILLDYASELSTNPANEVVIIVGHGPSLEADNQAQLALMENLATIVEEDGRFSAVHSATLQDDAPPEVRAANVERIRGLVEGATKEGKNVIVVTNLMAAFSIQSNLRRDLKGLDYQFNAKGLVQHDNFIDWIGETVLMELEEYNRVGSN